MNKIRGHLVLDGYEALGTKWWIEIFDETLSDNALNSLGHNIKKQIINFENRFSRFKEGSEVYELNKLGKCKPSEKLYQMIKFSLDIRNRTAGIFDPFLGALLDERGYGEAEMKKDGNKSSVSSTKLIVNKKEIRLPTGYRFDPGGFGKGYLIAKIRDLLIKRGFKNFLINGGGDIYVTSDHGKELDLITSDPFEPSHALGIISLKYKAFASSSSVYRSWLDARGIVRSHLIDPRDADREIKSTSYVIADDPTIADIAATILAIIDSDTELAMIDDFLEKYSIAYLLIDENGKSLSKNFPEIHEYKPFFQIKG